MGLLIKRNKTLLANYKEVFMAQVQPILETLLIDKEFLILEVLKSDQPLIISEPYRLPEGIETIAVLKDLNHARIAYKRLDGFFEFKFIQIPKSQYNSYSVLHHKVEAPTDRQGVDLLESIGWVCPRKAFDQVWDQVNKNRTPFAIPDSGKTLTPFCDLHFWKWLDKNEPNGNHHKINTRNRYLNELGYNLYKHTLSVEDIQILSYTLDHHWNMNFKPVRGSN